MREIIFRGKRIDNGEWVEGYLYYRILYREEHYDIEPGIQVFDGKDLMSIKYHSVDIETIGQFTGMYDKNGKRIFEGDVVVLDKDVKRTFNVDDGEVRYGWGGFFVKKFSSLNSLNVLAAYYGPLRGEVIGNIHDNPELKPIENTK